MHTTTESLAILFRRKTAPMTDDVLRVAVLTVPCLVGLWTAVACRWAQYHGLPGSDALVGGIVGCVFRAVVDEDSARPRFTARVRRLLARHLQAKGLVRRPPKLADWREHRRRGRGHGRGRLGLAVDLAPHQALSPRHRLYGPDRGLRDYSLHFSARGRRMERARALGTHGRRPRRRCWGIGGGRCSDLPAHRAACAVCRFRYVVIFGAPASVPTLMLSPLRCPCGLRVPLRLRCAEKTGCNMPREGASCSVADSTLGRDRILWVIRP